MVDRPVNKIIQAAEKIMNGDLSVRIEKEHSVDPNNGFNVIIDYFNRMTEELSGMETLRTDFIANVSHELKTPLAVMQNYGTLLQNPQLPEAERMEYAKAIIDASRNMAGMISNILKLNKLENQNIYPDTKTYNLGEQLCECLLGFEDVWEKKGIEIEADVEEQVLVKADPELLTLVWNNLFSNAIKFTEPGGKVKVTLNAQNEEAVVQISDTGCGITPEVGKHIFEKFYQGDTSHVTKGNGLGLALVKRVMDITKGDIQVSSEVGKGSTFTVRLRRERDGTV
jgi:signal transduction histidine kinase